MPFAASSGLPSSASGSPTSSVPISILIVEDDGDQRAAVEAALAPLGHRIVCATSAQDALRCLLETTEFAVILVDVRLPETNGFELATLIRTRESSQETPLIFLSALDDVEAIAQGYLRGAVDYIVKPFDAAMLRAKVTVFVNIFRRMQRIQQREEDIRSHQREEFEREKARLAAEAANQAKDQLLASVAHELRAPATVVLGYVELMRNFEISDPKLKRAIDAIARSARRQAQLIEDLLDFARVTKGTVHLKYGTVDVEELIATLIDDVRAMADAKAIHLEVIAASGHAGRYTVDADRLRLEQVLLNLLGNALKFTPHGGRITIRLNGDGERLKLAVSDTGRGIARDFLPHVFEPFSTAHPSATPREVGVGLGLTIARELVTRHGGSLDASSDGEGKGTTFTVTLPIRPPSHEVAERPAMNAPGN
jgi:signal transduction histidine kinase